MAPVPESEILLARLHRIVETLEKRLRALGFSEKELDDIKRQAELMSTEEDGRPAP